MPSAPERPSRPTGATLVPEPAAGTSVLAVDIGGTKLAVGVVDHDGAIHARTQVPTLGEGPEGLLATLVELIDTVLEAVGRDGSVAAPSMCGVGCGGPMDMGGRTVSPLNIAQWREFPLRERLEAHLAMPVAVDNDAKAMTLAEGWKGAAEGVGDYVGMVVSTGVGGGIVLDGRLLDGAAGNAGHIGHVIVEPGGRTCGCGAKGCLEAEASGTAIAAITGRPPREAPSEIRARTGMLVGRAVSSVAVLLDLRLATVAGSVALGYGDEFFGAAQDEIDRCARIGHARGTRIVRAGLGDEAPLVGAAAVALRRFGGADAGSEGTV